MVSVFLGLRTPDGIAYDWLGDKIYWTDAQDNTIRRIGVYQNKTMEVILTEGLDEPRAIVVSPCDGYNITISFFNDPMLLSSEISRWK